LVELGAYDLPAICFAIKS